MLYWQFMKTVIRKYLASALCLHFLTALTFSGFGSVLCLGVNGQIKVESVHQPCCNDAETDCFSEPIGSDHDHHADCTDCTDLPVIRDSLSRRPLASVSRIGWAPDHAAASVILPRLIRMTRANLTRSESTSPPGSAGLLLSTTVLRC